MNRRTLAIGAAITLPASFAAFHADASAPPPSAPARRRPTADKAIRAASSRYWATIEADKALDALPPVTFGSAEAMRREAEGERLIDDRREAVSLASRSPAASVEGLRLKAAMLADAMERQRGLMLEHRHAEWQLAVSVATDMAKLLPIEGSAS